VNDAIVSKDIYIVVNKTILNDSDREILVMLYQPIVGALAISLYFTLWSNLDRTSFTSEEYLHEELARKIGVSLTSIFESRQKLEAVGLIKTYLKKDSVNNYIYELYSPLNPHDIFNNPLLNTVLYTNLGKSEYKKLVDYFSIPHIDMNGYTDISCNFTDIFETMALDQSEGAYDQIRKKNFNNVQLNNDMDLNLILNMIPDEMLNKRSITKEIKDYICKLSFIYNLDTDSIKELISNSIDDKKMIDKSLLKDNCAQYYSFENGGKNPTLIYRTQPERLRSSVPSTSKKAKAIYAFETTSPRDFLLSKYNGATLSKNDTNLLEHLLCDMDLKAGVVNVLIDYVLRINDNKLPKNYVDAVASQWKRANIETVEEAMAMAKKEYQKKKVGTTVINTSSKTSTIKPTPKWLDEKIDLVEATNEEKQEIEDLLSEFK